MNSKKPPHNSPSWVSYGMSFVRILKEILMLLYMLYIGYRTDYELLKATPYLALMGELWSIFLWVFWKEIMLLYITSCYITYYIEVEA